MSAVRSLSARLARLEQANRPSVYEAMWTACADDIEAKIAAGISTDPDMRVIAASLRKWVRDGADRLWLRSNVFEYGG